MKKLKVIMASVAIAACFSANSAIISTDWKVDGDGLARLDEDTGIEWLQLSQTHGKSINQVRDLLETTYAGWRLPTQSEVGEFIGNIIGMDLSSNGNTPIQIVSSNASDEARAATFIGSFGYTLYANNLRYAYGFHVSDDGQSALVSGTAYNPSATVKAYIYNDVGASFNYAQVPYSVFLVSDGGTTLSSLNDPSLNANNPNAPVNAVDVSEPASATIIGLSLFGLLMGMRRKNKTSR